RQLVGRRCRGPSSGFHGGRPPTYLPADALPFRDAIGYMVVVLVLLRWPDGLISIRQKTIENPRPNQRG
ncbi:MAG: hypothetical protein HKO68_08170, partial [Desulfobacterales bacterium]|nr:hypothetical protein [Desulfobacterales bacterium]